MALTPVGFTGTVGQVEFARIDGGGLGDGMVGSLPGSANLRVDRVVGQDRRVSVQPGDAKVPGVRVNNNAVATYDFPANASGQPRLDWLVLRFLWTGSGSVALTHVLGTPAAAPVAPGLVQVAGQQWDLPLALQRVDAGVGAFPSGSTLDARYWLTDNGSAVQGPRGATLIDPPHRPGRLLDVVSSGELLVSVGGAWLPVNRVRSTLDVTLLSGWADFGGGYGPAEVDVFSDGMVHLRGLIRRTGAAFSVSVTGVQVGTLPAAARPIGVRRAMVVQSQIGAVRLDAFPAGELYVYRNEGAATFATNGFLSLDGVSFRR